MKLNRKSKASSFLIICLGIGILFLLIPTSNHFEIRIPEIPPQSMDNLAPSNSTQNRTSNGTYVDFVPIANAINDLYYNPLFPLFFAIGIFWVMLQYYEFWRHPSVKVTNSRTMQKKDLGRFLKEETFSEANLWRFFFKTSSGIREVYSPHSFAEFEPLCFEKFAVILWFMPSLVLMEIDTPEKITIPSKKPLKTFKNYVIRFLMVFFGLIQLKNISYRFYASLECEKEICKKIDFLMPIDMLEQLDMRFHIKYSKLSLNDQNGKNEWIPREDPDLPFTEFSIIRKDKHSIKDLEIVDVIDKHIRYVTIQQALKDRRSRLMERALFESRKIWYESQVEETFILYKKISEELTTLKLTEEERFHNEMRKLIDQFNQKGLTIFEVVRDSLKLSSFGVDQEQALKEVLIKKFTEEYNSKEKVLESENATLKGRLSSLNELLRDRIDQLKKNELNVRSEFPKQESKEV